MTPKISPNAALFAFRLSAVSVAAFLVAAFFLPVLSIGAHIVS